MGSDGAESQWWLLLHAPLGMHGWVRRVLRRDGSINVLCSRLTESPPSVSLSLKAARTSMTTFRVLFVLASVSVSLAACEEESSGLVTQSYPAAVERALDGVEFSRAPGHPMEVLQERVNVAVDAMYDVSNNATTWQEAHALAQEHIRNAEPGVIRATVEQSMAKLMLVGYLNPNTRESGTTDLALAYSQVLVDRGSPEAEAVLETVKAFGSGWSPADLQEVALGAAAAVEAHVAGGTPCKDCDLPAEVRRTLVETGKTDDIITLRRLDAARELRALAG